MRPVRIAGADPKPLGAPEDWSEEKHGHCGALFVRRENIDDVAYMRSAWEVEAAEAALLFAGAPMTLGIAGHCHPVVQLGVGELPVDFEPVVVARRIFDLHGKPAARVEMIFPHAGGRRGFCEVHIDAEGGMAEAVAKGVLRVEALARKHGWTD
jgi:hypothetical protein